MNFNNRRYITRGVSGNVDLLLQLFMWQCIHLSQYKKEINIEKLNTYIEKNMAKK